MRGCLWFQSESLGTQGKDVKPGTGSPVRCRHKGKKNKKKRVDLILKHENQGFRPKNSTLVWPANPKDA